jgi:two-component system LytT family response regulator
VTPATEPGGDRAATSARVRVLVADDEPLARRTLRMLLDADPDVVCIGECARGSEAIARIAADDPDVVLLDVAMPGGGGFDVVAALGERRRAEVIFVTAFDAHALRAFQVQALDYLLKPFDDARFARAMGRAKERVKKSRLAEMVRRLGALVDAPPAAPTLSPAPALPTAPAAPATSSVAPASSGSTGPLDRIAVRSAGKVTLVDVKDIDYIEAEDYYVLLHVGATSVLHREPMRDLEGRLPGHFVRIHRSTLVNAERICELRTPPRGEPSVVLRSGAELKLSRSGKQRLDAVLAPRR